MAGRRALGGRLAQRAAAPALVALAGLGLMLTLLLARHGGNPSALIHIGDQLRAERFVTGSTIVERGAPGYDGQYFFYLAHDPTLATGDPREFLDHPAYRYARILYPALVWIVSLGHPDALPWALVIVNLLACLAGTIAAVDACWSLGASRWLALGYAFSPAIVFGLAADLAEPTAYALVAAAVALALRDRHGLAGLALGLAALGREATVIVSLVFGAHALARRAWRQAAAYLSPLVIVVAWHLAIRVRLGAFPFLDGPPNFSLPLAGPLYRVSLLRGWASPVMGEPPPPYDAGTLGSNVELSIVGMLVTMMLLGLAKLWSRRDVLACQLGAQCALGLVTSQYVWIGLASYARVLGLMVLFYGLVLLTTSRNSRQELRNDKVSRPRALVMP